MSKCKVCAARKGKRICRKHDGPVCSECCGTWRNAEDCSGCGFYSAQTRKYKDVPRFTPANMNEDEGLRRIAYAIEFAIWRYDDSTSQTILDPVPIGALEMLLDEHHFKSTSPQKRTQDEVACFEMADEAISTSLPEVENEVLVKVIATILFVAKRRTIGGREYLRILVDFVGMKDFENPWHRKYGVDDL